MHLFKPPSLTGSSPLFFKLENPQTPKNMSFDISLRHITLTVKYYHFRLQAYRHIWFGFPRVLKINQDAKFLKIWRFTYKSKFLVSFQNQMIWQNWVLNSRTVSNWADLDCCCLLLDAMRSIGCHSCMQPTSRLGPCRQCELLTPALVLMQMSSEP